MFIQVRLLKGFPKPLLYKTKTRPLENLVGRVVHVPIQKRTEHALVIAQFATKPAGNNFEIREVITIEPFPEDKKYQTFIKKLSAYHQINPLHFFKRVRSFLVQEQKAGKTSVDQNFSETNSKVVTLTEEQQIVTDFVSKKIKKNLYTPTVLHGVTGSGKTECYKKMISTAIKQNKTALLLLPEVTLALQFEHLLRQQLDKSIKIFGFHSACSARQRKLLWKALLAGEPILIIGVHLPVLLPIANLGLIIVDEEHEVGYQEKKHPKINSKEAALLRAHIQKIPIILGSATPSVSSLYNVKKRGWQFFQLKKRFSGTFPTIKTVFLTDKKYRRNFWISQKLEDAIRDRLRAKEQTIIFLNRRGFSFFVQCKECGFIFECKNCATSLTLHKDNKLSCHYCEHTKKLPDACPECKQSSGTQTFIKKGIGTQQVVTILEKLFPHARIGRADLDTTRKKKLWQETLGAFQEKKMDILVGTQTITKGFHFPGVTLVGILWADLNLHFPIYNATETTLQQLIQVAGRAGRQSEKSTVIVQAMSNHPAFAYLNEIDYLKFYAKEVQNRQMLLYPPHSKLAELELKHTDEQTIDTEAAQLTAFLLSEAQKSAFNLHQSSAGQAAITSSEKQKYQVLILGPAEPPVSRIKRTYIRKIYLKSSSRASIEALFIAASRFNLKSKLFYTPNPSS